MTLKPSLIRQYLNVVRIYHLESGCSNPVQGDWFLKTLLRGIKRDKGDSVNRLLPVTITILRQIGTVLNLDQSQDLCFWSACLLAYFDMLRKSSLFLKFNHLPRICQKDCRIKPWGLEVVMRYLKTIQFSERNAYVSLPWNQEKFLCPVRFILKNNVRNGSKNGDFIFKYVTPSGAHKMMYQIFTSMLRSVLIRLNLPVHLYSGHSFRRGGATHALKSGIPPEVIKAQGDWKSMSYLDYLDTTDSQDRSVFISKMYTCT